MNSEQHKNTMETLNEELLQETISVVKKLTQILSQTNENGGKWYPEGNKSPLYASIARMCQLYSMSRDKLERILEKPVNEGYIRVLRPTDSAGKLGNKSYNLIDFENYFSKEPS